MEMRSISILNNQGVDLLRRGNLKKAGDTLQMAVDLALSSSKPYPTSANNKTEDPVLKRLIPYLTSENNTSDENTDQNAALSTSAVGHPFSLQVGLPGSLSEGLENASSSPPSRNKFYPDCLYLQTEGLYLTLETFQERNDSRFIVEAIVTSLLFYNLGLVSQLQSIFGVGIESFKEVAMESPDDSVHSRRYHAIKARFMYMACRLMLDLAGVARHQANGIPLLDLLSMALHNNSAYAAFADGQYETCRNIFHENELYIYSVVAMPAFSQWNHKTVAVMSRYMIDFLLNALILTEPSVASAA